MTERKVLAPEARPTTRMTDFRIVVDPPYFGPYMSEKLRIASLESWARELEDFVRDHRSQDPITVTVERVTETQCDQCGCPWEVATDDNGTFCAWCGIVVTTPVSTETLR